MADGGYCCHVPEMSNAINFFSIPILLFHFISFPFIVCFFSISLSLFFPPADFWVPGAASGVSRRFPVIYLCLICSCKMTYVFGFAEVVRRIALSNWRNQTIRPTGSRHHLKIRGTLWSVLSGLEMQARSPREII